MANLKTLFKDTALYGMSSIVGRFLNYLLVPLYTAKIAASSGGYGVITNVYAYTALLLVILTFGMETTFFRFVNKEGANPMRTYSTVLIMVGSVALLFVALVLAFINPVSSFMGYSAHEEYVAVMAACVAIDAFQCIPFAYLRYKHRPWKFVALKMLFIVLNITLNIVYFVVLPAMYSNPSTHGFAASLYDPNVGVGYVFRLNLFCTAIITFFFWKELTGFRWVFDKILFRKMLSYSWPILLLGITGILNQTADKILFPIVSPGAEGHVQLGIYGAAAKIAMIMAMITQAFRYAYEPFVFGSAKEKGSRDTYAKAMKYFIIFTLLAYLVVVGYLDVLKYIIGRDYWEGLKVVPVVMAAEIMMGVYFNLSFWYKLIDKTIYGAWFSGVGCVVLVLINVLLIPKYGYMACAWAGVAGYGTAMLLSYFVGQKKYPINYPLKSITVYICIAALFTAIMLYTPQSLPKALRLGINTLLIILFVAHIIHYDFPISSLPVIGRHFRKRN
ncbi:MAG: lipopolysaccharide biosynthesis protein [Prevotellaceae bacterium]|nr:lipopolysaccharide biosynthesis protein [Prevotellaceae bacterium]MDY4759581.1 lipopolysaccharide biosynthesis protein [Bacteroidaceae bacterium]